MSAGGLFGIVSISQKLIQIGIIIDLDLSTIYAIEADLVYQPFIYG